MAAHLTGDLSMPLTFWIAIALIAIVGFGVVNTYYWRNVRDEYAERQRKWRAANAPAGEA